jgi:hypothetical protein
MNHELILVFHLSSRLINVIPPVNYKHPHEWLVQYLIC